MKTIETLVLHIILSNRTSVFMSYRDNVEILPSCQETEYPDAGSGSIKKSEQEATADPKETKLAKKCFRNRSKQILCLISRFWSYLYIEKFLDL